MLCFLCCFPGSRRLCFCHRSRQLRAISSSDMVQVDLSNGQSSEVKASKKVTHPRRVQSEPPIKTERIFYGFIRFCSLREKSNERKVSRFRVSMVSIPSSNDFIRTLRKKRRKKVKRRREVELSSSNSFSPVPSEPRLKAEMTNSSDDEIPPERSEAVTFDFDNIVKAKSPSKRAILIHGNRSEDSSISYEEIKPSPTNFHIEKLQLTTPPPFATLPEGWNLKDSYKRDLEIYIKNSAVIPSNPWADPFEDDRRSRTEQWIEALTPGRLDELEDVELPLSSSIEDSEQQETKEEEAIDDEQEIESLLSQMKSAASIEALDESALDGVKTDVELIWKERPKTEEEVLQEVIIKFNGEPAHAVAVNKPMQTMIIPIIETHSQESLEAPTSEVSFISSTMDKVSLVNQSYRNNLQSALEHSGDQVELEKIERFWNYQYNSPEEKAKIEEKKRRRELERIRGHTPTMERVVMYYTSDKRPSLITISPSPQPSVRSTSSISEAYRLFDRKDSHPMSRLSFESEDLNLSMEKDMLAEEITIEVPTIAAPENPSLAFFRLDEDSSDDEYGGGNVEDEDGKSEPTRLDASPHPRLRISRATSTEDLDSLADGRYSGSSITQKKKNKYQSTFTQTSLVMEELRQNSPNFLQPVTLGLRLSESDSISLDEEMSSDNNRASSMSSPSKSVHFAQKLDTDIDCLPKHQHNPRFLGPKPILKRADTKTLELRRSVEKETDSLYSNLRALVEERDRSHHALEILPTDNSNLSCDTSLYQTNYRDNVLKNKGNLDAKIDHLWKVLCSKPLNESQTAFVYGVSDSKNLTLNIRRRVIPVRYQSTQNVNVERRSAKTNLEMASDYARKLADLRSAMIRRDSDLRGDEKSVEEILKRVSSSLAAFKSS